MTMFSTCKKFKRRAVKSLGHFGWEKETGLRQWTFKILSRAPGKPFVSSLCLRYIEKIENNTQPLIWPFEIRGNRQPYFFKPFRALVLSLIAKEYATREDGLKYCLIWYRLNSNILIAGDGLVVWLGMRLVFLVLLLGLGAGEVREADKDKDKDNDDKDDKVNKVDCLGGCTCHLETLTCCHLGHANLRKTDPFCRNNCSTTSMVIIDSILGPDSLSSTWLREQGVCPSAVSRLKVTNSSLENLNLLSLPMLKHLEIEGTTGPGWISEPPQSVTDLHLGGASWPCMAPDLNHQETSSKTSLTFGVRMSWLLKEHWASTWKDSNRTLCGVHESDEVKYAWYQEVDDGSQLRNRKPRTILSFLEFTKRTLDSCPPSCTCLIAKGRVQYEQGHHDAKLRSLQVRHMRRRYVGLHMYRVHFCPVAFSSNFSQRLRSFVRTSPSPSCRHSCQTTRFFLTSPSIRWEKDFRKWIFRNIFALFPDLIIGNTGQPEPRLRGGEWSWPPLQHSLDSLVVGVSHKSVFFIMIIVC